MAGIRAGNRHVAVVGAGLIGRSWAIVFARAGFRVRIWDPKTDVSFQAHDIIAARLPELQAAGLLKEAPDEVLARITPIPDLVTTLGGAAWVQENGPERVEEKTALFAEMDEIVGPDTILASSTSGIPASVFTEKLGDRQRCLVAHPVNPPYLIPLVELCPAPWTDPAVMARAREFMLEAGQVPATLNREIAGFALNRLQIALVSEAFRLVRDGIISAEDVDATVKHGLGLRWSFMGPLETIDLNAPGGLTDYCARYGSLYEKVQQEMTPCAVTPELVATLDAARRAVLPLDAQEKRQEWRDRRLMALAAHKAGQEN